MKIKTVKFNNRKKCFEITIAKGSIEFPYSRLRLKPTKSNPIKNVSPDQELGNEAFTYVLTSGKEDIIHIDQVLEYIKDPEYCREMLLYKLTIQAQKLLQTKKVNKREVIRRLQTSPTQFYRLLDQSFYNKTIDQLVKLLAALDCHLDIVFKKAA